MLTKTEINSAKPREKKYSLSDIRGLHLEVMPTGRKFWRLRYTKLDGKKSWLTIGEFPAVSVDDAREQARDLQQKSRSGQPLREKHNGEPDVSFEEITSDWFAYNDARDITDKTKRTVHSEMSAYVLPYLRGMTLRKISLQDVLAVLQRIRDAGKTSVLIRVKGYISQLFRYAAARGLADHDPIAMLHGAINVPPHKHYRSISNPSDVAELLRGVNSFPLRRSRLATTFAIYAMCRQGELRGATWSEIDLSRREWRIPAERMKKRRPHIVPLSDQLMSILDAMKDCSHGEIIFGGERTYN